MSLSSWYTREIDPDVAPIVSVPSEAAWHLTPRRLKQEVDEPKRRGRSSSDPLAVTDSFGLSEEACDGDEADTSPIISLIEDLGHQLTESLT